MLRYALPFLLCLVLIGTVQEPRAQAGDSLIVERAAPSRVSAAAAVALEYLFPTLGHAYAGDWTRGLPPFLVMVAGGVLIVSALSDCLYEGTLCNDDPEVTGGLLLILGGRV